MNTILKFKFFPGILLVAGILMGTISCSQEKKSREEPPKPVVKTYQKISVDELKSRLKKKDFLLVNVHTPYAGELPGTDLFIPFDQIRENLEKLPRDRSTKIVFYCRSGHMSALAADTLVNLGYQQVYDLSGGMRAWVEAGNELIRK